MRYVIGIGSNIGDRKKNIERAIAAIETLPKTRIVLKSSIYETQPVGYEEQDDFYNICLEVQSVFNPFEMIGAVLGIEAGFGRVRTIKDGPRIIDIEIMFLYPLFLLDFIRFIIATTIKHRIQATIIKYPIL